jgi:hypothetical protein
MRYRLEHPSAKAPFPNLQVTDNTGAYVFVSSPPGHEGYAEAGVYESVCKIPGGLLNDGIYFVGLALTFVEKGIKVAFFEKDALCVNLIDPLDETLYVERNGYSGTMPGVIRPRLDWEVKHCL